jgi:hypothetical protein
MRTLKQHKILRERSRTARLVQAGIWLAFIVFVVIGGTIATQAISAANASATLTTAQVAKLEASTGVQLPVTHLAAATLPAPCVPGSGGGCGNDPANPTTSPALGKYYNNSNYINLLPAFRWTNGATSSLYVDLGSSIGGVDQIGPDAISTVASMIFLVAGFLWWILLEVLKFGLTANFLYTAGGSINAGFVSITNALGSAGLFVIFLLIAACIGLMMIMRGRMSHLVKMIMLFILPLATMMALANAAAPSHAGTAGPGPVGSPSWVALQGDAYVNTVVGYVNTGFNSVKAANPANLGTNSPTAANSVAPTCNAYTKTLYNQYEAYNLQANGGTAANPSSGASDMQSVQSISQLWDQAYLQFWQNAQFGEGEFATLPSCHVLENNNQTSSTTLPTPMPTRPMIQKSMAGQPASTLATTPTVPVAGSCAPAGPLSTPMPTVAPPPQARPAPVPIGGPRPITLTPWVSSSGTLSRVSPRPRAQKAAPKPTPALG